MYIPTVNAVFAQSRKRLPREDVAKDMLLRLQVELVVKKELVETRVEMGVHCHICHKTVTSVCQLTSTEDYLAEIKISAILYHYRNFIRYVYVASLLH